MTDCLSESALLRLLGGEASEDEASAMRRHLDMCPSCAARSAELIARHDHLLRNVREIPDLHFSAHQTIEAKRSASPTSESESGGVFVSVAPGIGAKIGPYTLLEVLGEGGLGTVYLAQQDQPVRRRVALKVIKAGMDTKEVVRRFEAERQALAVMDHPNVAKVFDGGATPDGRPYFVMEHVAGQPVTEYSDTAKLNLTDRLALFIGICEAVQHAHQKGIIHRDIKPSNVLVSVQDGRAIPKVIDFGIAKAINQRLAEETIHTQHGMFIGTPEYMSPEQAAAVSTDIDTRTDIYSLGVLLYELLTGCMPFDSASLRKAGFAEVQRIIREVDPPRPSTRLLSLAEDKAVPVLAGQDSAIADAARLRRTDAKTLLRQLRADLDWVVMKCLEKDRTRRYETADVLAMELRRFMNNEPVLAGPPSVAYRMKKFVRRNRTAVIAAATVAAALVAGIFGTTTMAIVARMRQAEAVAAHHEAEKARAQEVEARKRAEMEAAKATAVRRFLEKDLLSSVDPRSGSGAKTTVREVLENSLTHLDRSFERQPELFVSIKATIGRMYRSLGLYDDAFRILNSTVEYARKALGEDHPESLTAWLRLTEVRFLKQEVVKVAEDGPRIFHAMKRGFGSDHLDTIESQEMYAATLAYAQRWDEAEAMMKQALEKRRRLQGEDHTDVYENLGNLGAICYMAGKYDDAIRCFNESISGCEHVLGSDHPTTLAHYGGLALLLMQNGYPGRAREVLSRIIEGYDRNGVVEHGMRVGSYTNLGQCYAQEKRWEEAESAFEDAYRLSMKTQGKNHVTTIGLRLELLNCRSKLGKSNSVLKTIKKLMTPPRPVIGEASPNIVRALQILAEIHIQEGKYDEAVNEARQAVEKRGNIPVLVSVQSAHLSFVDRHAYGRILIAAGKFDEAEVQLLEALQGFRKTTAEDGCYVQSTLASLVALYEKWDKPAKAEEYRRCIVSTRPADDKPTSSSAPAD